MKCRDRLGTLGAEGRAQITKLTGKGSLPTEPSHQIFAFQILVLVTKKKATGKELNVHQGLFG